MNTITNNTAIFSYEYLDVQLIKTLVETAIAECQNLGISPLIEFDQIKNVCFMHDELGTHVQIEGFSNKSAGVYIDSDGQAFKALSKRFKYNKGLNDLEVFEIFASTFSSDLLSVNFGFSGLMDLLNRQAQYLDRKEKAIKKELTSGWYGWRFVNRVKDFDMVAFKKYRSILLNIARQSHKNWLKLKPDTVTLEDKAKKAQLTIDRFSCVCDADMLDQEYKTIKAYERKK